jgi:hypothetical protein
MSKHEIPVSDGPDKDGMTFGLKGHLASGNLRGARFAGIYEVASRSGKLVLRQHGS